jgi:hypothetical protein
MTSMHIHATPIWLDARTWGPPKRIVVPVLHQIQRRKTPRLPQLPKSQKVGTVAQFCAKFNAVKRHDCRNCLRAKE